MANYALVKDGAVVNVIVADDKGWVDDHVTEMGYDRAIAVKSGVAVGPGYLVAGTGFVPGYEADVDKPSIVGDGSDTATISYKDNHSDAPSSVTGDVNGQPISLDLTAGAGTIAVTSTTPGDTVTVNLPGASVVVTVQ